MNRFTLSLFLGFVLLTTLTGVSRASGIVFQLSANAASPGSTIDIVADALPNTNLEGLEVTLSWLDVTGSGGSPPQFGSVQSSTDPMWSGAVAYSQLQPDGSDKVVLAWVPPITGQGTLLEVPVAIPGAAINNSVFQLQLSAVTTSDGFYQPITTSLSQNLLTIVNSETLGMGLTLGDTVSHPGGIAEIPLRLGNLTGVGSVDALITIPGVLPQTPSQWGAAESADLSQNALISARAQTNGTIHVVIADPTGLMGPGDLLYLPITLASGVKPGTYSLEIVSAALSDLNGSPLPVTTQGARLIVLPGNPGTLSSLMFNLPHYYVPTGSSLSFLLNGQDASGQWIASPSTTLSLLSPAPSILTDGKNLTATQEGVALLRASYQLPALASQTPASQTPPALTADSLVEAFDPPAHQNFYSPPIYGYPGDLVWVPVFFLPGSLPSTGVFGMALQSANPSATFPALEGQPVYYGSEFGMPGEVFAGAGASNHSYSIGYSGINGSSGAVQLILVPLQLPAGIPTTGSITYPIQYTPPPGGGSSLPGGSGSVTVLSPIAATLQIVSPSNGQSFSQSVHVAIGQGNANGSNELLFGSVAWDNSTLPIATFDPHHLTVDLDATLLSDGIHTLHFMLYNRLDDKTLQTISVQINHSAPLAQISYPTSNAVIKGSLKVTGTAEAVGAMKFSGYQLIVSSVSLGSPLLSLNGTQPVQSGTLGTLDLSKLAIGKTYYLRLVVTDNAGDVSYQEVPFYYAVSSLPGDLDGDGQVTLKDVILLLKIVVGVVQATPYQKTAGDLNGNGVLDLGDVLQLLQMILQQ